MTFTPTPEMIEAMARAIMESAAWSSFWSEDDASVMATAAATAALIAIAPQLIAQGRNEGLEEASRHLDSLCNSSNDCEYLIFESDTGASHCRIESRGDGDCICAKRYEVWWKALKAIRAMTSPQAASSETEAMESRV